ncbi:uncharacterized protein LOC107046613 [Diachasma alloeum]|uniref:uncharacterized protein LOC107046613 n=1 Tax=Diachasma alloeum TaxID=454923 RepID=UPI000738194A|nr:uncharacterized protein LOC107046613 [Diachasma alloeum]
MIFFSKMAADPLDAKINKIRQQNEEIRRRYEEVEADKKNAAKSNALVQMVPSTDWPQRKEPPEFFSPPQPSKTLTKPRNTHSPRDHKESIQYRAGGEGKKGHTFCQSEGPPPDPKYNFLADSEREEPHESFPRESDKNKARGKTSRPHFRKQRGGREFRGKTGGSGQDLLPDYEAWRAERNKIDEARISRQRTAEGNWRREWDNDKIHLAGDITKRDSHTLGDAMRYPRNSSYSYGRESDDQRRIINSTDQNAQINNSTNGSKNVLMSVKVSSSNIAGTGRVGPRQRSRVVYSSQSEKDSLNFQVGDFTVETSPEDKLKYNNFNNSKGFHSERRNDSDKSPQALGREHERNDKKFHKNDLKSTTFNSKDLRNFPKFQHVQRQNTGMTCQSKSSRNIRKFDSSLNEPMMQESVSSEINEIAPVGARDKNVAQGTKSGSHDGEISIVKRDVKEVVETAGTHHEESPHIEHHESFKSSSDQFHDDLDSDDVNINVENYIDAVDKHYENINDYREIQENEDEIKIDSQEQKQEEGVNVLQHYPQVIDDNAIQVIDKAILNSNIQTGGELRDKISVPEVEEM